MLDIIHTDTITEHGNTYRVDHIRDYDMDAPWENSDCHGVITDWVTRDKKPSELLLSTSRTFKRFYDVKASIEKATREGWGLSDPERLTPKQIIAESVRQDYERLKAWCNDEWFYIGVVITEIRTDSDGFTYDGYHASLWGLESDCLDTGWVYRDLIGDIEYQLNNPVPKVA